jgi:enoyl-CoA hydratase/carnithine racemase
MSDVLLVEQKEHICTVTLNRPEKRNSLSPELARAIRDAFSGIKAGGDTRVVVLRGVGDKAFCAGADLGAIMGEEGGGSLVQGAIESVVACPCVVIAMIYGHAVGAGCDLAASCDIRVMADTAKIGINPVKLGLVYFPKSIERLISLIGVAYAKEMLLSGRFFTAQRAKEMGLANYVVPAEELETCTYSLAQDIGENAPLAIAGMKSIINRLQNKMSPQEEKELRAIMERSWTTEDFQEGARAFIEKRKPNFKGK